MGLKTTNAFALGLADVYGVPIIIDPHTTGVWADFIRIDDDETAT
jgi:hypothetical protein